MEAIKEKTFTDKTVILPWLGEQNSPKARFHALKAVTILYT